MQALMPRRPKKQPMSAINVVPYIDVMLVLLIIFMITAPLLSEGVKVALPQANAKPITKQQHEPVIITVNRKGLYFLNIGDDPKKAVDATTLVSRVAAVKRQRKSSMSVLVRGDRRANYGDVVNVMALLQQAGVDDVGLITKTPSRSRR